MKKDNSLQLFKACCGQSKGRKSKMEEAEGKCLNCIHYTL